MIEVAQCHSVNFQMHGLSVGVQACRGGLPDGEAKVGGADGGILVLGQEQEVVGLDVAVNDALGVALRDEAQHRADDGGDSRLRQRSLLHAVQDAPAAAQLHHHMDVLVVLEHPLHIGAHIFFA